MKLTDFYAVNDLRVRLEALRADIVFIESPEAVILLNRHQYCLEDARAVKIKLREFLATELLRVSQELRNLGVEVD